MICEILHVCIFIYTYISKSWALLLLKYPANLHNDAVFCLIIPRTMATWGGSTQCALDEEGDEDGYLSEAIVRTDEEEEEEQDASSNDNFPSYHPSMNQNSYNVKETKNRLVSVLKFYLILGTSGLYDTKQFCSSH